MTTSDLVLPSLQIQGFRIFKNTTVKKLERINLIVGKNNVGKTSFLEALWLYAQRGSPYVIGDQLAVREESAPRSHTNEIISSPGVIQNIFHGRSDKLQENNLIKIGPLESPEDTLSIHIGEVLAPVNPRKYLFISLGDQRILALDLTSMTFNNQFLLNKEEISNIFISSNSLTNDFITSLWDKTALTSYEDEVIRALQIITPDLERVNMISDPAIGPQRIAMMRLKGQTKPVPLRSYGDGMNRLFVLALAAANASNGLLLIDEIENGLHYSVQLDVWRLIFDLAHRLNIQVFATTHSWDCIEAFQTAATEHPEQGQIIRLGRKQDSIVATRFDEQELAIITRDQIEVR